MKIRDLKSEVLRDEIKEAIKAFAPTHEWSEEFADKLIKDTELKTIYRAVGGNSQRSTLNDYTVKPYMVVYETTNYYYTYSGEKVQLQHKRVTSNSQFFEDANDATRCILDRIDATLREIHDSWLEIQSVTGAGIPPSKRLFLGKFNGKNKNKERFRLECFEILRSTKKAYYIDTGQTRTALRKRGEKMVSIDMPKGRCYIYPHQAEPHNPSHPFEKWIMQSEDMIKLAMCSYYESRIKYLNDEWRKLLDWRKEYVRSEVQERLSRCVQYTDVNDSGSSQERLVDGN